MNLEAEPVMSNNLSMNKYKQNSQIDFTQMKPSFINKNNINSLAFILNITLILTILNYTSCIIIQLLKEGF